ncbi:hypothetical protein P5P86_04235 [Nocardioides sp. BP30]|uniref:hypothetical protein n=1 Tax=Nocardioides sp. BP30 TaxID=3036374 RepID=UPI002468E5E4|nr:hypothetical protein [Nocardioides sp. BP30]WGL53036.1 hypothetical protein P5P86_04235 [Nocardioides sp. BP30]
MPLRVPLLALGALGLAMAAPSSAVPGVTRTSDAAALATVTAAATRHDLDPGGGFPAAPPGTTAGGIAGAAQGVVAQRAKQYIATSPSAPIYFLAYIALGNTPAAKPTSYSLVYVPDPFNQPACAASSSDPAAKLQSLYYRTDLYAAWPPKGGAVPGAFPPIQVKTVAFGSIPVTATLQLHQTVVDGKLEPLLDQTWAPRNPGDGGGAPCDKSFSAPVNSLVTGRVDISLTNLKVDGVPVEVGSSCRTVRPVDISLWGFDGYYPGQGGRLGQYDGAHAGSLGKLDSPYYGEQNGTSIPASTGIDVPPFTGCRDGGDDVSPLITAMASGPDNPVAAEQSPINAGNVNLDDLTACATDGSGNCPVPAKNPPAVPPH